MDGGRVQGLVVPPQPRLHVPGDGTGVGQNALEWGCRPVVGFADLRSGPDLGLELLLWPEVIRQQALERLDPVQQFQLRGGVVAVVADGLAHDVPVFLFHMRAVVLVPGPGPGERQVLLFAPGQQFAVDELRAVIGIKPNSA